MIDLDAPDSTPEPTPGPADGSGDGTTPAWVEEVRRAGEDADETLQHFERPGGLLSKIDGHLVMYHEPHGLQAEQYRTCRANLTALNRQGAPWAIAVTSSKRGEGKSVTAANLAACLAELPGTRVCLADLDSRSPGQEKLLGVEVRHGVTELVQGDVSYGDVVNSSIIENLDFIGAGAEPDNPAELLGSDRFVNLMDELKRRYSWIVLDTPPVNPWTDACVVSALVNGALVVVRLQDTPRSLVNRTIDSITVAGGAVFGTFLTGLTPDRDDAERQGYYRVDAAEYFDSGDNDATRLKARARAERRLRRQEKALLKRQVKQRRKLDEDDETLV